MLSRVAERLYWTARYLERAENTARLVKVFSSMMLDLPNGVGLNWRQLVDVSGAHEHFDKNYRSSGERNVIKFMLSDPDTQGSVISSLAIAPPVTWYPVKAGSTSTSCTCLPGKNSPERHSSRTATSFCQKSSCAASRSPGCWPVP